MWYTINSFNEWYENEKNKIKNNFETAELIGRYDFIKTFSNKITKFKPSTNAFTCWDLMLEKNDGKKMVVEVKIRNYQLNYFLNNGAYMEKIKYNKLYNDWKSNKLEYNYIYANKTSDNYWVIFSLNARFSEKINIYKTYINTYHSTVDMTDIKIINKNIIIIEFYKKFDKIYDERGKEVC